MNRIRVAWAAMEAFCASPACPPPAKEHVTFVLAAFRTYEEAAASGVTLERAFGLKRSHVGASWMKRQANADRDRMLREIRARHLGELANPAAVGAICAELAALNRRQDLREGTFAGDLARAELCARVPRSPKQLEKILCGNPIPD